MFDFDATEMATAARRGTFVSLRSIWRAEGVCGLYRGLGPTLIGYLPTFSIYFPAYHNMKHFWARVLSRSSTSDPLVHVLGSMSAGAISSFVTHPLWLVRTRLMTQSSKSPYFYRNTWHALRTIYAVEGLGGLWKGMTPAALGLVHVAVQFPLYERAKLFLRSRHPDCPHLSPFEIFLSSALSKMAASTMTYPHEVLRTRFQSQVHQRHYRNIPQAIGVIWREEGLRGFYRGLPTTLMRVVPAAAVTFVTFEWLLNVTRQLFNP